jgi:hypothetical protein
MQSAGHVAATALTVPRRRALSAPGAAAQVRDRRTLLPFGSFLVLVLVVLIVPAALAIVLLGIGL